MSYDLWTNNLNFQKNRKSINTKWIV